MTGMFERLRWRFLVAALVLVLPLPSSAQTVESIEQEHPGMLDLIAQEYVLNILATDEKFTTGRFADRDDMWKREKALEYFWGDFEALLSGLNLGGQVTQRWAALTPTGTELLLITLPDDSSIVRELHMSVEIAEMNAEIAQARSDIAEANADIAEANADIAEANADIAEANADIAEQLAIQAALRALISTLQQHSE